MDKQYEREKRYLQTEKGKFARQKANSKNATKRFISKYAQFGELKEVERMLKNKIKEDFEMENTIFTKVIKEIEEQIKELGYYCDSDCNEGGKEALVLDLLEELDLTTEEFNKMETEINNEIADYLESNYKIVLSLDDRNTCKFYYYDKKYEFGNVSDLENHFNIGE